MTRCLLRSSASLRSKCFEKGPLLLIGTRVLLGWGQPSSRLHLWVTLGLKSSGLHGDGFPGSKPQVNFPPPGALGPMLLSWDKDTGVWVFAGRAWARDSPVRGGQHLLIGLVSYNVVDDLEVALGPGRGTRLRGEEVTP